MDKRPIGYLIGVVILIAWVSVTIADTVPEEAQRYMARGLAAVEMAKTPKDYKRAVREFEQATKLEPNWPDVHFNLGSVQAKTGNYGEAMRHFKRYLELAPNAPDAAKVREEIYKLEYRAEEQMAREIKRDGPFIAYDNDTVLDTQTNLMWAAKDNGDGINWQGAKKYCENYQGGGYTDWRMPTLSELAGLYDAAKTYKSKCPGLFAESGSDVHLTGLISLTCNAPWASETYGSSGSAFEFTVGGRGMAPQSRVTNGRALPVRSVKEERVVNATSGYLGTALQKMTEELARASGLNKVKGAFVLTVNKNSPAERASLKSGDIILSFDGKEINEMSVLPPMVTATPVGKTVDARIYRDGKEQTVKVKIGNRQSTALDSEKASVPSPPTGAYKGVRNYAHGDKYEGVFVDGKFTSKGTFTCGNRNRFTGNLEGKEPLRLTTTCD
jgi:tetratricopeptide (TPR) repeat protein